MKEIDNKYTKANMNIKAIVILTELKYTLVELNSFFDWPNWLHSKVVYCPFRKIIQKNALGVLNKKTLNFRWGICIRLPQPVQNSLE